MGFQLIFGNKNWKKVFKDIGFLDRVKWFIFGGHRYYDPPKIEKDGSKLMAVVSPPIWKRLYYRYLWKIVKSLERPNDSGVEGGESDSL